MLRLSLFVVGIVSLRIASVSAGFDAPKFLWWVVVSPRAKISAVNLAIKVKCGAQLPNLTTDWLGIHGVA